VFLAFFRTAQKSLYENGAFQPVFVYKAKTTIKGEKGRKCCSNENSHTMGLGKMANANAKIDVPSHL
jgi:hypothetical protein